MEVLGLSAAQAQDREQLKRAYHRALLRAHPDKSGGCELTVDQVKAAYHALLTDLSTGYAVLDLDDFDFDPVTLSYSHPCRCGQAYNITESDLEKGMELVGCDGCSLIIRVSYELAD